MRPARLALLTAAVLCGTGLTSRPALAGAAATAWEDLWRTPDQQGQALLDAGKAAQAAARFHDPRRRAYAELQAGGYQQAAQLLAPFSDARSEYNRGNALADSGQLQAALMAYDAALKQDPSDRDARHNRDLVERALRKQRQSAPSSSSGNRGRAGQGGQRTGASGQQQRQGANGRHGGSGSQQSGARGSQSPGGGGGTASNGSQAAGHAGNSGQKTGAPQATGANGAGSRDSAGQARRDAAFAAALARQHKPGGAGDNSPSPGAQQGGRSGPGSNGAGQPHGTGDLVAGGTRTPQQKPETEQQLALDQWLRQIPDSPAGLLRRKFLIERMMRQQAGDDPQGEGP
jgi:Ca-activated chloride channel homolog